MLMLNPSKHADDDVPILTAADLLAWRWRTNHAPKIAPPHTIIICYQHDPIAALLKRYRAIKVNGFSGELYALKTPGKTLWPIEMNVVAQVPGAELCFCRTEDVRWDRWSQLQLWRSNTEYFARGRMPKLTTVLKMALARKLKRLSS